MKYIPIIAKVLLAIPLLVFGVNKLLPTAFLEAAAPEGAVAQLYLQAFFASYLAKTVALIEVVVGVLLFVKRFELVALLLLAPVSLNILFFHLFHEIEGTPPGLVIFVLNIYLLTTHKNKLAGLIG